MPTLILLGGPFDGREVKSKIGTVAIPDELGFARTGGCEYSFGDAGTGPATMFDQWSMEIDEPIDDTVEFPPWPYKAHYHRDGQVDDRNRLVFAYAPHSVVFLSLAAILGGGSAISRSQAKQVLKGIASPARVILDFDGIESAGHSFLDEAFRVWRNDHLHSIVAYSNASPEIEAMIRPIAAS